MRIGETSLDATKLTRKEDGSFNCPLCRRGTLHLVEERPHPLYGVLGVTEIVLWCDAADCGQVTVV
jgi:hypothetical protein